MTEATVAAHECDGGVALPQTFSDGRMTVIAGGSALSSVSTVLAQRGTVRHSKVSLKPRQCRRRCEAIEM